MLSFFPASLCSSMIPLLLLFSRSVVSNSLWPQGLPHVHRLPCPSPSPGVCSNSCPLNEVMPSKQLILYCLLILLPSVFPSIRVFFNESALPIRWPKYWNSSFSISPSNEYSGLISFRINWFILLAVQGTLKHLLAAAREAHTSKETQPSQRQKHKDKKRRKSMAPAPP